MKKIRKFPLIIFSVLLILTAVALLLSHGGTQTAYAASYDPYGFEYTAFHVSYDVRTDRTMDVTYDLGVHYTGYQSTGLMFDIPVNRGDRVRNIKACELTSIGGSEFALDYTVKSEERELITVDMGDYSNKTGQTHYYRIKFEYAMTRPAKDEKNAIFLNAIGFGHEADLNDVQVTINLPDGFIGSKTKCATGLAGVTTGYIENFVTYGNTVTLNIDHMREYNGITFSLYFDEGILSTKPDMTPYWIIIAACVILALLFAVKFLAFNKDGLTPVSNVEAPDDMDPLVMGKLIDNKVDKSDVTSLIYYWANKGYIKIDLKSETDVDLIRIYKALPVSAPNYQRRMYSALFGKKDIVSISSLTNTFYPTVDAVTKTVNAENARLYDGKSMAVAVLFALAGALFMGLTPFILAFTTIAHGLMVVAPLFMIVPAFIVFALTQTVHQNRLKLKKIVRVLLYGGIVLLCAAFTLLYLVITPSYVIEVVPKIVLSAVGFTIIMLSTLIISRTPAYVEKLNEIVGFRDFILYTEKEKLEMMLEENPELYYKILPYAIVLGVSDVWENKFAALTVAPPDWCTSYHRGRAFNFVMFSSVMRRANTNMTNTFRSRPSSASSGSYSGGSRSGGGGFGGHSGGGHGGGGSRGR